eukprot:2778502-Prymnesium_polylepis.1
MARGGAERVVMIKTRRRTARKGSPKRAHACLDAMRHALPIRLTGSTPCATCCSSRAVLRQSTRSSRRTPT